MKYTEIDLQIEDLMWFGIDKNGLVFEATSGGCTSVPDFVVASREINERLNDYFLKLPEGTADAIFIEKLEPSTPAYEDCLLLTKNGITCFDMDDDNGDSYKKITETSAPKKVDELPDDIKQIMSFRKIEVDVLAESKLYV